MQSQSHPTLEPRVSLGIHLDYTTPRDRSSQFLSQDPMYPHPSQQQSPHQSVHPQAGQPQPQYQQPYPSQLNPNRPEMAAIHPQYPQPYGDPSQRLPAPQGPPQQFYPQAQPQDYRTQQPQTPTGAQAAPRQRTAIACKYCRRRKIRCSGFENAADGRCANCIRFNQECVFTPVSSQSQAFVPAQALYGRRGAGGPAQGPQQLYGPYGQPLPPQHYPLPSPGHPPMQGGYPPQGYPPPGYPPQGYPPQQYEQQQQQQPHPSQGQQPQAAGNRRRRESDEPHTPTLPPPNPGPNANLAGHEQQYVYPDQQAYAGSPATAQHPYPGAPGYYPGQSQRTSPGSAYSYEQPRGSNSPHPGQPYYQQGMPPQQGPAQPNQSSRTPPPGADGRNGLAIRDIVSDNSHGQGERTAADSDMVSALNRTSRR